MFDDLLGLNLSNYFTTPWFIVSTVLILSVLAAYAWFYYHQCDRLKDHPYSEEGCRSCRECDYFQDGLCICQCHLKGAKPLPNLTVPLRAISPGDSSVGIPSFNLPVTVTIVSEALDPQSDWFHVEEALCKALGDLWDCQVVSEREATLQEKKQDAHDRQMEEENNVD